jgi:hypothetical protein
MADVIDNSSAAPNQNYPVIPEDATIILPIRNTLLFPGIVLPLTIGRPSSIAATQEAVRSARKVGLLLQDDAAIEQPGPEHLRRVGTSPRYCAMSLQNRPITPFAGGYGGFVSRNFFPAILISSPALRRSAYPK